MKTLYKQKHSSYASKGFALVAMCVALSGCSMLGISDGSLDYLDNNTLPPLNMGNQPTNIFKPAFRLPAYPADDAVNLQEGLNFEMPRPDTQPPTTK